MRRSRPARIAIVIAALWCGSAGAATFDVQTFFDHPDTTPGDGWCMAMDIGLCTLRAAIQEANATPGDDVINLPQEHYVLTVAGQDENAAATGDLDVAETVTIYGQGADVTIIDANGIDRVFELHGGTLELVGVTITGGSATTSTTFIGGGIRAAGSQLVLNRCRVEGNTANLAGGVHGSFVTPVRIIDTELTGNSTQALGFANPWGAAIQCDGGLFLQGSTVSGNTGAATGYFAVDAQCYGGSVSILNSTIADNQAAGVSTYNCDATLVHTTIAGNASYGLILGSFDNSHMRMVTNSVLAYNLFDCNMAAGTAATIENSIAGDDSCDAVAGTGFLSGIDPLLLPLRDWGGPTPTMYPQPVASPAIDVAGTSACTATDQRGEARGRDGNGDGIPGCDMGAVEAGDLVFFDGFDDGTMGAWSSST